MAGFPRRRVRAVLGGVHGYITRRPPVRKPLVVSQAIARPKQRRPRTAVVLGRPHGGRPHVRKPIVLLARIKHFSGHAQLGKPHGYKTRKPPVRPLLTKLQAITRAKLTPRLYVETRLRRPRGSLVVVPPPHARKPTVLLARIKHFSGRVILGRPHGYKTRKPPTRKLLVVLARIKHFSGHTTVIRPHGGRPHIRKPIVVLARITRFRGHVALRKPRLPPIVVIPPHVRKLTIQLARIKRFRGHVALGRPHGYQTRKAPVRPLLTKLQAVSRATLRPRLRTHTGMTHHFGGLITQSAGGLQLLSISTRPTNDTLTSRTMTERITATILPRMLWTP